MYVREWSKTDILFFNSSNWLKSVYRSRGVRSCSALCQQGATFPLLPQSRVGPTGNGAAAIIQWFAGKMNKTTVGFMSSSSYFSLNNNESTVISCTICVHAWGEGCVDDLSAGASVLLLLLREKFSLLSPTFYCSTINKGKVFVFNCKWALNMISRCYLSVSAWEGSD